MREKTGKHPLAIVDAPALTLPEPPRTLGEPGLTLWRSIQSEFRVVDVGGVQLLLQACLAADRAEALRARIDADGETIATQTGMRAQSLPQGRAGDAQLHLPGFAAARRRRRTNQASGPPARPEMEGTPWRRIGRPCSGPDGSA
jgi:hypothetical protein